jgi:hypothetical protein
VSKIADIIDQYRQQPYLDVTVSMAVFSDNYKVLYWEKPLNEVERFTPKSSGQSALLESACKMIDEVGKKLAEKPENERPEKVVFITLTVGQDSISDLQFTKQQLQEKIQLQQTIYSWQFLFPETDISQFHSTIVRISEPVKRTTFQFAADIGVPENGIPESVYESVIDYVYEWVNLKLGASTPERQLFSEGVEFDRFILPSLRVATIPEEGQWCCRLVHADELTEKRPAIPGMTWTSDIALHCDEKKIHFAIRIFVTATNNAADEIVLIRPRLVADIAKQFQLVEAMPIETEKQKEINGTEEIEQLYETVILQNRQIPILVITKEQNENLFPILFQKQLEISRQSILSLAHVIALPKELREEWNRIVGELLTIPNGGVRIYYPNTVVDETANILHPSWTAEEIQSFSFAYQNGISAFAAYLKDCLSKYAAEKPMEWGSCLFYPKMRSNINENRKKFFIESKNNTELLELLTNDNNEYKRNNEELAKKIKSLEHKNFELQSRLNVTQYRQQPQESEIKPVRVKIRKDAKKELDKIDGKSYENICNIIKKCSEKQWRDKHIDWKWNKNDKTDLTIIKPGATAERIVGYEKDAIFFITHVFDSHDEYVDSLPNRWIEEFRNDEYVDI